MCALRELTCTLVEALLCLHNSDSPWKTTMRVAAQQGVGRLAIRWFSMLMTKANHTNVICQPGPCQTDVFRHIQYPAMLIQQPGFPMPVTDTLKHWLFVLLPQQDLCAPHSACSCFLSLGHPVLLEYASKESTTYHKGWCKHGRVCWLPNVTFNLAGVVGYHDPRACIVNDHQSLL